MLCECIHTLYFHCVSIMYFLPFFRSSEGEILTSTYASSLPVERSCMTSNGSSMTPSHSTLKRWGNTTSALATNSPVSRTRPSILISSLTWVSPVRPWICVGVAYFSCMVVYVYETIPSLKMFLLYFIKASAEYVRKCLAYLYIAVWCTGLGHFVVVCPCLQMTPSLLRCLAVERSPIRSL